MPKTTPMIRFSLKDRGRKHTGQPRNFNVKALFDHINGDACQEIVASRGMIGYYGHWPRIRFGMMPSEGVMDGGKYVPLEPAFVTTHLKVNMDGIVEHQAEFADTASGQLAAKLFDGMIGGFSSAIDENKPRFCGFDYVYQPNFLGNSFRGVALDDAMGGNIGNLTYDDVLSAEQEEHTRSMIALLDSINSERNASNAVIERLQLENEQYLSMLSRRGIEPSVVLDAVSVMPVVVAGDGADRFNQIMGEFDSAQLPNFVVPEDNSIVAKNPVYNRIINKFIRY